MVDNPEKTGERVKELFRKAEEVPMEPSPFMKTRILAHVREDRAEKAGLRWKAWALASSAVSALLLAVLLWNGKPSLTARVDQRVAVKVEVEALVENPVAYAKVELPEGLSFYSRSYPELAKLRELELAWNPAFERNGLPIVVEASSHGTKTIRIFLMDRDHAVLKTKQVSIRFLAPA